MDVALGAGLVALVVTSVAAPGAVRLLGSAGTIDVPNGRSLHASPVPRGGGLACALGVASGALVAAGAGAPVPWPALVSAFALALVGFLDDRTHLPASPRLLAQVVAGAALGAVIGGPGLALLGAVVMPVIVNAVNFMDGINGITALSLAGWGVLAAVAATSSGQGALATIGVLTATAALGFLPWNAPRARLFLGDVGSYLFGALAAGGILLGAHASVGTGFLVAAPLLVYLTDTGLVLVRRVLTGRPVFQAHREHTYQRLVTEAQLPHLLVAAWTASIAMAVALVWQMKGMSWTTVTATITLLGAYIVSPRAMGAGSRPASRRSREATPA